MGVFQTATFPLQSEKQTFIAQIETDIWHTRSKLISLSISLFSNRDRNPDSIHPSF